MKNIKQLLADFYLNLLALPDDSFQMDKLRHIILDALACELDCEPEIIQNIFERMAREDKIERN